MKNNKVRVLFFVDRMRVGGIQILLINLFEHFDMSRIECELLVLDDGETYDLEAKAEKLGVKVHKLKNTWIYKPTDYISYSKNVDAFFKEHHDYDVVHMHSSSKNFMILKCAKKYNIPIRIAHSHNTGFQTKSWKQILVGNIFKMPLKKYSTHFMACSAYAAEWLFGKKEMESGKVTVLLNGIDLDKFRFSDEVREQYRKELGVEDKLVIGNVGRFTTQKNHGFLIDIFEEIHKKNENTVLLLAGIGEKQEECEAKVKALGLEDSVKFLGFRTDIMNLTQAFDIFLMPSLHEGFPVTGIEAQAVGLPCAFADTITREAKIIEQVKYIPLEKSTQEWADEVLALAGSSDRKQSYAKLKESGFDINDVTEILMSVYSGNERR